jgi:cytochrome c oxidase cbb3-type subunit 4
MDMDVTTLRIVTTVLSFALFAVILVWAWSRRRAKDFEQAEQLPFTQD